MIDPVTCTALTDSNATTEEAIQPYTESVCTSDYMSFWLLSTIMYKYVLTTLCCYVG